MEEGQRYKVKITGISQIRLAVGCVLGDFPKNTGLEMVWVPGDHRGTQSIDVSAAMPDRATLRKVVISERADHSPDPNYPAFLEVSVGDATHITVVSQCHMGIHGSFIVRLVYDYEAEVRPA